MRYKIPHLPYRISKYYKKIAETHGFKSEFLQYMRCGIDLPDYQLAVSSFVPRSNFNEVHS